MSSHTAPSEAVERTRQPFSSATSISVFVRISFRTLYLLRVACSFNNYKYAPLGQNRELEVNGTVGVTVNISEIVVLDGELFNAVINAIANGESPVLMFTGVIEGRNGSQERVTYRECILSGDSDIQNVATGDVLKRSFALHCNGKVENKSKLTI